MNALDAAIYTRLSSTSAITSLLDNGASSVFHLQASNLAQLPYVVFNQQSGGDKNTEPHRIKDLIIFIRAYSLSAKEAGEIDEQIDAALHHVPLTVSGWSNLWLVREQDLELVENPPNAKQIYMAGGLYRTILEET